MKTILLISPYWRENHRWMVSSVKLAELWQRLGYRVVVACMGRMEGQEGSRAGGQQVSETLTIYRKPDVFLPDPWNYGIAFGFTGFVRRIIEKQKPDIIVVNKVLFWTSLCVLPLRFTGHRVILLTDALVGMTWWGRTRLFRAASIVYAWTVGWLILLAADRIVFFHPQPARLLRRLRIAGKSCVIPTGIDPLPYGQQANSEQRLAASRSPLSAHRSLVITYVGRLESVKGVDDFLAAATAITDDNPNAHAQVVGWFKPDHPLVRQYGDKISFLGLREDIPTILASTDIFVLPSHSEGLSNALMEAMASGCACIASEVGGNAFLIENGISGLLFPAGDREALRAHLQRLIEDPAKRRALGDAARKRIEEKFSWEVVGRQYHDFFQNL